jgi:outer membrane protein assembly factor BamB
MNRMILRLAALAFAAPVTTLSLQAAQDSQPTIAWTQHVGRSAIDIEAGDLNGDGRPDFAVASFENTILAINSDGRVLWRFGVGGGVPFVAVGDLDGDGLADVVGIDRHQPAYMHAISGSGAELWNQAVPSAGGRVRIGDVTGDGKNDIVAVLSGSSFDTVSVFDNRGVLVFSHDVLPRIQDLALADVNGDGHLDIVLSYGAIVPVGMSPCPCGLEAIDGANSVLWNYSTQAALGPLAAGDINNDGHADVVAGEIGLVAGGPRQAYAVDSSGSLLWTFPLRQGVFGNGATAITLGDLDRDGSRDVVIGSFDQHVYGIRADGQLLWDAGVGSNIFRLALGDLNGDGREEIAAATMLGPTAGVYALDTQGHEVWFFPKTGSDVECPDGECVQGFRDLVVEDVNGDGRAEVVAIQDALNIPDLAHGLAFAFSTPEAEHVTVSVDIKPGSGVNSINTRSHGTIPVAILSGPQFDAPAELNTGSLTFGRTGNEASLAFCHPGRVNRDALVDVICHFDTRSTGFVVGDTVGILKGETVTGVPIQGSDSVRIVR